MPKEPRDENGLTASQRYYRNNKQACRDRIKAAHVKQMSTFTGQAKNKISKLKSRCKASGIECNLDVEWYTAKLKGCCELTGRKFKHTKPFSNAVLHKNGNRTPTIDRIDPKGGYTKDNCRMVTWEVNQMKRQHSDSYLLKLAEDLVAGLMKTGTKRVRND